MTSSTDYSHTILVKCLIMEDVHKFLLENEDVWKPGDQEAITKYISGLLSSMTLDQMQLLQLPGPIKIQKKKTYYSFNVEEKDDDPMFTRFKQIVVQSLRSGYPLKSDYKMSLKPLMNRDEDHLIINRLWKGSVRTFIRFIKKVLFGTCIRIMSDQVADHFVFDVEFYRDGTLTRDPRIGDGIILTISLYQKVVVKRNPLRFISGHRDEYQFESFYKNDFSLYQMLLVVLSILDFEDDKEYGYQLVKQVRPSFDAITLSKIFEQCSSTQENVAEFVNLSCEEEVPPLVDICHDSMENDD